MKSAGAFFSGVVCGASGMLLMFLALPDLLRAIP